MALAVEGAGAVDAATLPWQPPYPPSWIDRLTGWIATWPVPEGVVYLGIGSAAAAALTLIEWAAGAYPVGTVRSPHLLLGFAIGFYPWLVRMFNVAAGGAFRGLGAMLVVDPERARELEYRLVTLPAGPTLLAGLAIVIASALRFAFMPDTFAGLELATEPLALAATFPLLIAFAFIGVTFPLKVGVQAWLIHRITTRDIRVSLFEVGPLYAFSNFTARMAIGLAVTAFLFYVSDPVFTSDTFGLASMAFGLGLAGAVFILPLYGVHRRLVEDRERLRSICRAHMAIVVARLQRPWRPATCLRWTRSTRPSRASISRRRASTPRRPGHGVRTRFAGWPGHSRSRSSCISPSSSSGACRPDASRRACLGDRVGFARPAPPGSAGGVSQGAGLAVDQR